MNISWLLVLVAFVCSALACSPAQKENIEKLDKNFGVQPFYPNGELETNGYSDNYVSDPSDVNCNFNTPESQTHARDPTPSNVASLCKWTNMVNGQYPNLDTEQWFLFHKSDNKKWALLKPRRSRAAHTPKQGDGFALTGGEGPPRLPSLCKRYLEACDTFLAGGQPDGRQRDWDEICRRQCTTPPQSVLYSSPFMCTENELTVGFDYWIYSLAGVRVMALEQDSFNVLWAMPKGDSACSRSSPRDGRCLVRVPPQDRPFHLAIQGYNLGSKFVIVDNIEVKGNMGETCVYREDPLDFGTSSTSLGSRTNAGPITRDSDLNSDGSAGPDTRWSNSGEGDVEWESHRGPVDADKWQSATGGRSTPSGNFLMARGEGNGRAELMSDPIDCQMLDGTLSLRAWASANTDVEVCVVDAFTLEPVYACDMLPLPDDGVIEVPVYGPLDDVRIMIVGSGWADGSGGFVAVDDLKYETQSLCVGVPTEAPTDPDKLDEGACQDLSTDFDEQTVATSKWKSYSANHDGFIVKEHEIANRFNPTPNTEVRCNNEDGKCAGLELDKSSSLQMGIMESPSFTLTKDRYIEMLIRRGTYGSLVHMCKNDLPIMDPNRGGIYDGAVNAHCTLLAGPSLTNSMYRNGEVVGAMLPTEANRVYLVYTLPQDSGANRGAFLVDDIRVLRGTTDQSGALCETINRA